jgi:type IV pilus assembly protein PilA
LKLAPKCREIAMNHLLLSQVRNQGFNLVELVVVVAIIGVMAAVAIPSLSNVSGSAQLASCQRNAQHVVSIYAAGATAGVSWPGTTRNGKIASVVTGGSPTSGVFITKIFRVPDLTGTDLTGTYPFIGFDANGDLFYDMAGHQSSS